MHSHSSFLVVGGAVGGRTLLPGAQGFDTHTSHTDLLPAKLTSDASVRPTGGRSWRAHVRRRRRLLLHLCYNSNQSQQGIRIRLSEEKIKINLGAGVGVFGVLSAGFWEGGGGIDFF